jgi:hypothetical protein
VSTRIALLKNTKKFAHPHTHTHRHTYTHTHSHTHTHTQTYTHTHTHTYNSCILIVDSCGRAISGRRARRWCRSCGLTGKASWRCWKLLCKHPRTKWTWHMYYIAPWHIWHNKRIISDQYLGVHDYELSLRWHQLRISNRFHTSSNICRYDPLINWRLLKPNKDVMHGEVQDESEDIMTAGNHTICVCLIKHFRLPYFSCTLLALSLFSYF